MPSTALLVLLPVPAKLPDACACLHRPTQVDWPPQDQGTYDLDGLNLAAAVNTEGSDQNASVPFRYLYLGYRLPHAPYDVDSDPNFWGGVNVVGYNDSNVYWSDPTRHLAMLVNNSAWAYQPAGQYTGRPASNTIIMSSFFCILS